MHKFFRQALPCFTAVLLLAGCATETKPPTGALDPGYTGPGFRKYFVVGLSANDLVDNREYENQMVAQLINAGVLAVPGWQYMPTNRPPNEDTIRAAILKSGADAVLLSRLSANSSRKDEVVAAVPLNGYRPEDYGDKYGYAKQDMGANWYTVGPVLIESQRATLYTTVFDVKTRSSVWSFNVPGFSPATLRQDVPVYINQVVDNLLEARLLRP